jgi:hypothetical protein
MTIKDQIWLLAHSDEPEDRREWAVLYWKYQGKTHREVADKLVHGKDWVQRYMTAIYRRFDAPKDLDRDEKFEWLVRNVFPALKEFLENNPDIVKELPPPEIIEGDVVEPPPPPPPPPPGQKGIITVHPQPRSGKNYCLLGAGFGVVAIICIGIVAAVAVAYRLYQNPPALPASANTPYDYHQVQPSPTISPVVPSKATDIPVPTSSQSEAPTAIPFASSTPKPYYDEGEAAVIKDGVYVSLDQQFNALGLECGTPPTSFGVRLRIDNNTGKEFILRYDSGAFHAVDDLGNPYELKAVGVGGRGCHDPLGVSIQYPVGLSVWLFLEFSGQAPLDASSYFITAERLSGAGPFVFRKGF